jgi:hypothetical protein
MVFGLNFVLLRSCVVSWDLKFFQPIPLPGKCKPLVTLRDAVEYMTELPRAEPERRTLATRRHAACDHWRARRLHVFRRARRGVRTSKGCQGCAA